MNFLNFWSVTIRKVNTQKPVTFYIRGNHHSLPYALKLKKMNKLIPNRNLTIINFVIVSYFILLWLINSYKIEFVLIGVFRELLTIPFFIAQIVFLIIGMKSIIKHQRNLLQIISVLLLAICAIMTIGSFF